MTSRVSVIVPCRDHGHLLGDALDSILGQGQELDVVVVDDHSTDDTVAIAKSRGVRVLPSHGRGAAAARNTGVAATTGKVVGFLDADDEWTPNSLSLRLAAIGGYDAAYGAVDEFVDSAYDQPTIALRSGGPTPSAGTVLITRDAFATVGPFEESLRFGEFIDWFARFVAAGLSAARVDEVVLRRRIHATNSTRDVATAASLLEVARRQRRRQDQ